MSDLTNDERAELELLRELNKERMTAQLDAATPAPIITRGDEKTLQVLLTPAPVPTPAPAPMAPTMGRIVILHEERQGKVHVAPAIVLAVKDGGRVDLQVFGRNGGVEIDVARDVGSGRGWSWPPRSA